MIDIPLINESLSYARGIDGAVSRLNVSAFRRRELVNLIHRFDSNYYESEKKTFLKDPDSYHRDFEFREMTSNDFLDEKVSLVFVFRQIIKIAAHRLYRLFGLIVRKSENAPFVCLRKCYVDDVEGLFEENEQGLIRLVYPFPLSFKRQVLYLRSLWEKEVAFRLSGLPYSLSDLFSFIYHRDYRGFIRLEKKAQYRHALEIKSIFPKVRIVQCAEEYDIGSFYSSYLLKKKGVLVHNCAHGVGKYLPYHNYSRFDVMTQAQAEYYEHFNSLECRFFEIKLLENLGVNIDSKIIINLLGQASPSAPELIEEDEFRILEVLNVISLKYPDVYVGYKAHPNSNTKSLDGFEGIVLNRDRITCREDQELIQLSLYSTCQIDPNFAGVKVMVETELLKPKLAYGDFESVVHFSELHVYLEEWVKRVSSV